MAGELDWIVIKALEKDRARRYESANDMARDVQRYLDDEAVEACPPTAAYRLKKFSRRHKAAFMTGAAVAVALVLGLAGTTWQAIRATTAEEFANEQQTVAESNLRRALAEEKRRLLRMDFSTYRNAWINIPTQIIRGSRQIVYRFLSWNPWQSAFFRLLDALKQPNLLHCAVIHGQRSRFRSRGPRLIWD